MSLRKVSNTEIMKLVRDIESQKEELVNFGNRNSFAKYTLEEKPMADLTPYALVEQTNKIGSLDANIRYLKHLLNLSNATTIVEEFNITLGEALVYMAQISQTVKRFTLLANTDKVVRTSGNYMSTTPEYTEAKYDIDLAKQMLSTYKSTLSKLQMAIDKTNLTNEIEVKFAD